MGTYVYALNTNVRTISGQSVGVAEYRYKLGGWRDDERDHKMYCARRIAYFDNHPEKLPLLMTMSGHDKPNSLVEGYEVYVLVGVCFSDGGGTRTKVGNLKKVGNRWTIAYIPGGEKLVALAADIRKQKDEMNANLPKEDQYAY